MSKPRYQITIEVQDDPVPANHRLKRWLKYALRSYGIRVLDYRELPQEQRQDDASGTRTASDEDSVG